MASHSSTLAWKIPWMEEPGGLPSMGSHRVGHDWCDLAAAAERLSLHFTSSHENTKITTNCSVMSNSLRPHGLYSPWNSPGQNTGVGSLSLLQGIFPTQGSNLGLFMGGGELKVLYSAILSSLFGYFQILSPTKMGSNPPFNCGFEIILVSYFG